MLEASCVPRAVSITNVCLALIDCLVAFLAFWQLLRIHSRNAQVGWTRQKVFHLIIGSSNVGYFIYFMVRLIAACRGWICWSSSCGFIFTAFPQILLLAAFLLLLSFWVDLCHQADDEDDDDDDDDEEATSQETLLEKSSTKCTSSSLESQRKCFPLRFIHAGSRQKIVIMVIVFVFVLMFASAVLIWFGAGENLISPSVVAHVYVDFFSVTTLLVGVALACYGLLLFMKMRKVRSERASFEMWKVASLAIISVLCFTLSALVALLTDIPIRVLYDRDLQTGDAVYTSLFLILYYFIGSSIPSASLLWVMRELPAILAFNPNLREDTEVITFIDDNSVTIQALNPQRWTTTTSLQNQISRASPI